ncbi:MAG: hypothetical protein ACTSXC_03685 [Candidatus Freyarchaeota archaeon]
MARSRDLVLAALADHKPKSLREVVEVTGLSQGAAYNVLADCWRKGLLLRTKEPIYEFERRFKGRAGISQTTRPYHLYLLRPDGRDHLRLNGREFVKYAKEHLDVRGGGKLSKAQRIINFLKEHKDRAFFSKEIQQALKDHGVLTRDVMSCVRRYEKKGLVYVRGYKTDDRQTPFKKGYLITWLNPDKPREEAIEEAIQKTDRALADTVSSSPLMERVHSVRDTIIEHSKLRKLVSFTYLHNKLGCTKYEAEHAVSRALQLYPDLKEIKLFNAYRYYYHTSMAEEDLQAAIAMKRNLVRMTKGRENRIGHNWEAVAEWFIDKFTTGAKFWTQSHRDKGMDPRRITLHLLKSVGGRRRSAEVDRVWEVTPGVFAPPITYVLSCKWGLVNKRHVDDFLEVLRWSKEFGVDTPDGRQVKQGVVGVFAASAFNPKENVRLKDETTISLASYAARMEIQLLKASDFNEKLRERGCPKGVTVQKVCKVAEDEKEVRELLDAIWKDPEKGEEILAETMEKNEEIYRFEKMLEQKISAAA